MTIRSPHRTLRLATFASLAVALSGCLMSDTEEYRYTIRPDLSGYGRVIFTGIGSDEQSAAGQAADIRELTTYYLRSEEFIADIRTQNKTLTDRRLYEKNGTLVAEAAYKFSHVSALDGIEMGQDTVYKTLPLSETVLETNGQVVRGAEEQQVVWPMALGEMKLRTRKARPARVVVHSLLTAWQAAGSPGNPSAAATDSTSLR